MQQFYADAFTSAYSAAFLVFWLFQCLIFWIPVSGLLAFIHKNRNSCLPYCKEQNKFFLVPWFLTLHMSSEEQVRHSQHQNSLQIFPFLLDIVILHVFTYTHNLLCPLPSFLSSQCFPTSFRSLTYSVKEHVPVWFCSCSEAHFPYCARDITLDQSRINYIWWMNFGRYRQCHQICNNSEILQSSQKSTCFPQSLWNHKILVLCW